MKQADIPTKAVTFLYGDNEDIPAFKRIFDLISSIILDEETEEYTGKVVKLTIEVAKPEEYEGNLDDLRLEETYAGN